jgi:hypothetical protein
MNRNLKSLLFLAVFILMSFIYHESEKSSIRTNTLIKTEKTKHKKNHFTSDTYQQSQWVSLREK